MLVTQEADTGANGRAGKRTARAADRTADTRAEQTASQASTLGAHCTRRAVSRIPAMQAL